jgi:hypothetical protein
VSIEPKLAAFQRNDVKRIPELISEGHRAASDKIESIRKIMKRLDRKRSGSLWKKIGWWWIKKINYTMRPDNSSEVCMKKILIGVIVGICAGIVDVVPMMIQKLSWDANISAFSAWVIIGFLIATSDLKITGIAKGLLISFLIIIPVLIIIGWKDPVVLSPVIFMTTILGGLSGLVIEKLGKQKM